MVLLTDDEVLKLLAYTRQLEAENKRLRIKGKIYATIIIEIDKLFKSQRNSLGILQGECNCRAERNGKDSLASGDNVCTDREREAESGELGREVV